MTLADWQKFTARLSPDDRYRAEKRAAIAEYDGGMQQGAAYDLAAAELAADQQGLFA